MAATYGKMLLEKNEQLQQELQDLQKVAEETALENQVHIMLYVHKLEGARLASFITICIIYYYTHNPPK